MRTRISVIALLALVSVLGLASSTEARCAFRPLGFEVLGESGQSRGSFLIALRPGQERLPEPISALPTALTLTHRANERSFAIVPIAPGLGVVTGGPRASGPWTHPSGISLSFNGSDVRLVAPAPELRSLHRTTYNEGRSRLIRTVATLRSPVPPGVVAIVARDAQHPHDAARGTFGVAEAGASSIAIYETMRCSSTPDGLEDFSTGSRVVLFYVTADGRLSPASAPIRVQ